MKIAVIIQARMSSKRCPGKMLLEVNNKPILQYVIERVEQSKYFNKENIIIATSFDKSDDKIYDFCIQNGYECFRDSLNNVALRYYKIIKNYKIENFVRICGDSPLIDANLIDYGVGVFINNNFDIVTNILNRTYPKGESIEIICSEVFLKSFFGLKDKYDLEHVTSFFYNNHNKYKIYNFENKNKINNINLSIDTFYDLECFKSFINTVKKDYLKYSFNEIIDIYKKKILMNKENS